MKLEKFLETFDKRIDYLRQFSLPKSVEIYFTCMREYYVRVINAKKEGKPLAWVSIMSPIEIFHAMDIIPFVVDTYAITVSAFSYFKKEDCIYFDIGDSYGYPSDACSPHRACVGMAAAGILPPPDVIYATTPMPCDSAVALFDVLSDMYRVPTYFANFEYRYYPEAIEHLKAEFLGLIEFLEEVTGKAMDEERLKEIVNYSRIANNAMIEIHQLRKKKPCPIRTRDAFNSFGMRIAAEGTLESVKYFEQQLREVKGRVDKGQGALPEERFRLGARGAYPFFAMELLDWLQNEFGAIFVADLFNCTPWRVLEEEEDPLSFIARKSLHFFGLEAIYGPMERVIDQIIDNIKAAEIDGFVCFAHFGCKQGCALQKIYRDKVIEKLGIPTLFIDHDISDPKVVSVDQIKDRFRQYIAMVEKIKEG